jgi:hypothetical protein
MLYKLCIKNGCSPSSFWTMTPSEVYVFLEAVKQPVMYGSMTQDDVDELTEMHNSGDFI